MSYLSQHFTPGITERQLVILNEIKMIFFAIFKHIPQYRKYPPRYLGKFSLMGREYEATSIIHLYLALGCCPIAGGMMSESKVPSSTLVPWMDVESNGL